MPLIKTTAMFKKAYDGGFAIGAFNVNNMEIVQGMDQRHLTTEGMRLANQKAMVDLQSAQHDLSMRQKYDDDYFKWRTKGFESKYLLDQIRHGLAQQQYDFNAKVAQDRANKIRYDANLNSCVMITRSSRMKL